MEHKKGQTDAAKDAARVYDLLINSMMDVYQYSLGPSEISLAGSTALYLQGFPRSPNDIDFYVDDIQVFDLLVSALRESSEVELTDTVGHNHARARLEEIVFDLIVSPTSNIKLQVAAAHGPIMLEPAGKIISDSLYHCRNSVPPKIATDAAHFLVNTSSETAIAFIDPDKKQILLDAFSALGDNDENAIRAREILEGYR